MPDNEFWDAIDRLVSESEIIIDRPKGTVHPKYPDFIYQVDYGYLKNTTSMDNAGIDVWVGSIGIDSPDKLIQAGAKQAFLQLKQEFPNVCLVHLYTL